jgi:hypothetical protein
MEQRPRIAISGTILDIFTNPVRGQDGEPTIILNNSLAFSKVSSRQPDR